MNTVAKVGSKKREYDNNEKETKWKVRMIIYENIYRSEQRKRADWTMDYVLK